MSDYIDRQEVIKKLNELDSRLMRGHYADECAGVTMANAIVQSVPAADVVPVVHGRWLNFYNDFSCAECDRCGTTFEVTDSESNEGLWNAFKLSYNYCPNCGAKMDGED